MAQTMTSNGKWTDWPGWDYVPGIAFIALGALALWQAPTASLAGGIYLGAILLIAGCFALVGGIANIQVRGAWLAALLGLLSILVGVMVLYDPTAGAVSLVWVMGAWLIVGGVFELVMGFQSSIGRGWLILIGIIDVVLGGFIVTLDPAQAYSFLGYFIGVSFILRGIWAVVYTSDVHHVEKTIEAVVA